MLVILVGELCFLAIIILIIIFIIGIFLKFATPIAIWSAGRNVKKGLQSQHQTVRYENPPVYYQPPPQYQPPPPQYQPPSPHYQTPAPQYYPPQPVASVQQFQGQVYTCPKCDTPAVLVEGRFWCNHCQMYITDEWRAKNPEGVRRTEQERRGGHASPRQVEPSGTDAPSGGPSGRSYCMKCGGKLAPDALFCEGCGAPVNR